MATRRQRGGLAAAIVVVSAGFFLFFARGGEAPVVRAVEVKSEALASTLTTNGRVEPLDAQEVRAAASTLVRKVVAKEGDRVQRGQVLAELDPGAAQSQVAKEQAELQAAEADLDAVQRGGTAAERNDTERKLRDARAAREEAARTQASNERLLARSAIPRAEVEQSRERLRQAEREVSFLEQRAQRQFSAEDRQRARARVESAHAALAYARRQLGDLSVRAPMAGTVYSLPIRAGNFVRAGDLLARVGNLDQLRVVVFVDEPELGRVAPGQEIHVTWTGLSGQQWTGRVETVPSEIVTMGTRSVGEVKGTIENPEHKLVAGVNVDVEVIVSRRPAALTLPKEALSNAGDTRRGSDQRYVFVLENGTVYRRLIKVGASTATRFEVVSGLQPGEKVAIPGERPLEDGMKVKVQS